MPSKISGQSQSNQYSKPLKDNVDNYLLKKNIHPAETIDFINSNDIQSGGDGYTIDVNRSIGGLAGRSRYSFNYSPIYYGDLIGSNESVNQGVCGGGSKKTNKQNGGDCDCGNKEQPKKSIFDLLKMQSGGSKKLNQFDAIQQIGKGLVPLSMNALINLVLLIFLYHSVVDKSVDNKKIKKSMKGGMMGMQQILAPLGRGNLLVLSALLLLHHFAVEKPKSKKKIMKGGNAIYEKINEILQPLGNKGGISIILSDLYKSFKGIELKNNKDNSNQKGGSILKAIVAPLGTSAFIATGLLIVLNKLLLDNKSSSKIKKGGSKQDFDKLVNLLGPLSFNAFANENFIQDVMELNQQQKIKKTSSVKNKKV